MSVKKIFLGLPAYNEKASIQPLFEKIAHLTQSSQIDLTVLFYDDGCSDGTKEEVYKWNNQLSIIYLDGIVNKGLGAGLNTLVTYFIEHGATDDALVIMDCDDTHDPMQIPQMIQAHHTTGADVVIASRFRQGALVKGVPYFRVLTGLGASLLYKMIHPIKNVKDYTCGYRFYTHTVLKQASLKYSSPLIKERGFACMVELLLKLKSKTTKMTELALQLRYDNKRTPSKMDVSGNIVRSLKKLLDWRIRGLT